jgi:hypothetical protein
VAAVGDQPAVTKSQQRVDINSRLTIYDTPGMLWPKIEHPIDGLMMAASHAVGVNAYIDEEVATFLTDFLLEHYPALLTARYGFSTEGMDGVAVIAAVAKKRGCLLKNRGGELDLEKAATILINDYRSGTLRQRWAGSVWKRRSCGKRAPGNWPRLLGSTRKITKIQTSWNSRGEGRTIRARLAAAQAGHGRCVCR